MANDMTVCDDLKMTTDQLADSMHYVAMRERSVAFRFAAMVRAHALAGRSELLLSMATSASHAISASDRDRNIELTRQMKSAARDMAAELMALTDIAPI